MPKKLFFELDEEKKLRILSAALMEFAHNSYHESSTNNIVKEAGIGKGSLFKYFTNKEDLYFYIIDSIISNLVEALKDELPTLTGDLLDIVFKYSEFEFAWYLKNPSQFKLIKRAFIDDNSEIYQKTLERYQITGDAFYHKLFENLESEQFKWDKADILNILKWCLKGFNEEFIKEIKNEGDINLIKTQYEKRLREYMKILKLGLYYKGECIDAV